MEQQTSLSQRGERLFLNSVRSPHSRRVYKFFFDKYLRIHGYKEASDLLARNQKEIETEIIEFIISSTEKGMKYAAILNYIKPVITFAKINDLMVNSKKINRYMPPNVRTKKTTAYTHEQISKLLEVADERMKAVILLCSSAGLRIGSIPSLNWGSLQEVSAGAGAGGDLYQITVYEGEPEEYITYCSSEAKKAILSYISVRERFSEVILPSSPLIREQWDRRDSFAARHPKRVKTETLAHKIAELARVVGLRNKDQLTEDEKDTHRGASRLKDVPQCNGMRRFFTTQLVNSGVQTEHRWLLEGHNLKGNDNSYVKISPNDLFKSYMLAHDNLLISQEHKLREKVEKLEVERSEIQTLHYELKKLKQALKL